MILDEEEIAEVELVEAQRGEGDEGFAEPIEDDGSLPPRGTQKYRNCVYAIEAVAANPFGRKKQEDGTSVSELS